MYPYFADLRTIQGAVIGTPNGADPQIYNPNDPWGRVMNYPKIWIQIGDLFQISREDGFLYLVSLLFPCFCCVRFIFYGAFFQR